jgi:hypothetical protein
MHNPQFYEKQRMRAPTWDIPRFLQFFDETTDGGLIVPRGMLTTVTELAVQAGSKLDLTDERTATQPARTRFWAPAGLPPSCTFTRPGTGTTAPPSRPVPAAWPPSTGT